ncbi:MAG: DegT/DnrJ/EryC1/StrS family aminotransferase [Candidatus Hodarchaeota archaeon]
MNSLELPIYIAKPIIDEDEINAVTDVLRSGRLVDGPVTKAFEKAFAKFVGTNHAIFCANGTMALHLALEALDLQPGMRVLTSAFTFIASSNSILFPGGIPEFVDIDEQTLCIDPNLLEQAMDRPHVKAIMPIHIFGLPANMNKISQLAKEKGMKVIEDCAQAHGGLIEGRHVGTFGDISCFSFYATKNMMSGEGGIVVTNDDELASACRQIRNHGRPPEGGYRHQRVGFNFRGTEMAAAILNLQLKKLPRYLEARRRNVSILKDELEGISSVRFQDTPTGYSHANYICALVIERNSELKVEKIVNRLKKHNIFTGPVYDIPSHKQPTYQNIEKWRWAKFVDYPDYKGVSLPKTEIVAQNHFQVPIHPSISEETMKNIASIVKKVLVKDFV